MICEMSNDLFMGLTKFLWELVPKLVHKSISDNLWICQVVFFSSFSSQVIILLQTGLKNKLLVFNIFRSSRLSRKKYRKSPVSQSMLLPPHQASLDQSWAAATFPYHKKHGSGMVETSYNGIICKISFHNSWGIPSKKLTNFTFCSTALIYTPLFYGNAL